MRPWDIFGDIRCIHIKARTDRDVLVKKVVSQIGVPLRYFYASPHPEGGVRGCYESHLSVMRESLALNQQFSLIFEDDLEIGSFSWERLNEAVRFITENPHEWDIFYLGCFPDVWGSNQVAVRGNIYKVRATQTHAYIVNKPFMERMVVRKFDGTPIDEVFLEGSRSYAILPTLFVQASSASDVSSVGFISVFPAKRIITQAVELYARSVGFPIRSVLLAIVFACVAVKVIIVSGLQRLKHGKWRHSK